MKKIILSLCLLMPAILLAQNSFNEQFDINIDEGTETANRITEFYATDIQLDDTAKLNELDALQKKIESLIKSSPNDPARWFLSGLNHNNMASVYASQNQKSQADHYSQLRNNDYQKAMILDAKKPAKLSAKIYATMKHGLPENERIRAIEQELAQGGSGDNEDQYWQLHWSRVSALDESGRYEEAEKALHEMQQQMQERGVTNPDYQKIINRAQKSIDQHRGAQKTPEPAIAKRESKNSTQADTKNILGKYPYITWILFGLAILAAGIALLIYALRK